MSYTNPLSIFSAEQIESLSVEKLKSLKKETLLYFQLSDDATIERNGKQLDKNQVLEIFDTLQTELDLHLKIHKNKALLEFLEYQKMDFFTDKSSQDLVLNDPEHKSQINDILAEELNKYTSSIIANIRFSTLGQLELIADYSAKVDQKFQDKSYSKSYRELKAFVDKMREQYPSPFIANEGLSFHPDLDKQVKPLLYRCFEHLPGPFQDIGFLYAAWCHNDIVNKAMTRETDFTKYKRLNLKTISKAMEIAINVSDNDSLRKSSHQVKEILKGKSTSPRQTKKRPANPSRDKSGSEIKLPKFDMKHAKAALLVVLVIITGLMLLSKFTGQNYTTAEPPTKTSVKKRPVDTKNKRLETNKERKDQLPSSSSNSNVATTSKFIGDNIANCNPVFINSEEIDGLVQLNFSVDIFPTKSDQILQIILNNINDRYRGLGKDFRVNFYNKKLQSRIFSHDFSATLDSQGDSKTTEYLYNGTPVENIREKISLPGSRLPRNKSMHGSITKFDINTKRKINNQLFEIKINNTINPARRETNSYDKDKTDLTEADENSGFADETFLAWQKYQISNGIDQTYKDIILHNCNQIAFKSSRAGQLYSIADMASYHPSNSSASEFRAVDLAPVTAFQRIYSQSLADKTATFDVGEKGIDMRIFVSQSSQLLLGFHMASVSKDGKVVELIEVFFD